MKSRSMTVRIPPELKRELQATDPDTDLSELVRRAIRQAIDGRPIAPPPLAESRCVCDTKISGIGSSLAIRLTKLGLTADDRGRTVDLALSADGVSGCTCGRVRIDHDGKPYVCITMAARNLGLVRSDPVRVKLLNISD
jgi:hypothetical protein